MKRFKVVTLGCRTNQYESQAYTDQLRQLGYTQVQEGEEADICVVNTCTVTESADSSSRHQIRSLLRANPNAKVAVTGCMVENSPDAIQALDPRIQIVSNLKKEQLVSLVLPEEEFYPEFNIQAFDAHTRAFLKVQDGCNSFCTYCTIPYVRGRSRSRKMAEILVEAKGLIERGFKEIVLTGINIGDFEDEGRRLADLVRAVDELEGLKRLRVSSIDPDEVDDDLTDAILNGRRTCPSMHIVLQSGSNVILKRMNRKYTRQIFMETVERLTRLKPDFTVTTDAIVGFPGESDADFADTMDLVEKVQFAKVHMFPYSPRKRTRAALYPNKVPPDVISERKHALLRLAEKMSFKLRDRFLGRTMSVLLENSDESRPGYLCGHTENFLRVWVPQRTYKQNDLIDVKLLENEPDGLIGEPV
ncbi:MAG: tRNA (N(6)-L-threonylcarbamoyladenosine(37)-C(2))-methylthiotransferase MtaB [Verrucomicrobia bacterium]|nr:tRNA (N(6)-L-threonylcarbamoyladenosine(37)-C(2))-methylthiotransferase MtaB [Verrucomicrobiota bacterium]